MDIRGAVQGVGFRPFLYRLAGRLQLAGWAQNTAQGVVVEVEGADADLRAFLVAVERDKPACARVAGLESTWLDAAGYTGFAIRESVASGDKSASLLPDIATCADCLAEVLDPGNRRWLYPFTNCTQCGPRYTVLESLPYDRPHTTMKHFTLCAACRAEYEDPGNRRFHAQPNACPDCGPHLELWDPRGTPLARHHEALRNTADRIRAGHIVAVKGLGGFHLVVDARNEAAVRRLRRRKHREEKPFAILAPSGDWVRSVCRVDALEERLLNSPEAPIVLLRRREKVCGPGVAAAVAP
ncbi:MAG: carbamoyltransferase HypF, partial [Gammaproteobacteria bacterium]|nr:carbamoyltransferase HypF [Gemmatimonadota bacterium]NIU79827.1 carbamoyltransferase HypF [Gammaproteobacteria bacterium]